MLDYSLKLAILTCCTTVFVWGSDQRSARNDLIECELNNHGERFRGECVVRRLLGAGHKDAEGVKEFALFYRPSYRSG